MPEIALAGCTPEPLMSYLKSLGLFRLVAEQADRDARLGWRGGIAVLHSKLDRPSLMKFFLEQYQPTPILTPWNSASGFAPTKAGNKAPKDKAAREAIERIKSTKTPRFMRYREAIERIGCVPRGNQDSNTWKQDYFARCRADLSDTVVDWLDACFALTNDAFSALPLLGSGGNDGVTDFGSLFMQRLNDVLIEPPGGSTPEQFLISALFSNVGLDASFTNQRPPTLLQDTVGQFNPSGIGGPNATQGSFEAKSEINPWDFVLMLEGALFFAGSVSRRLGANAVGRSVFPFCVESVAVGYGSATASEETTDGSRAELWLPLWSDAVTLAEAKHLFAEGRAQIGRRQARNAVEFALAVNLLGVSRGVKSFTRYGFLKRNGLAFLAAPLGRLEVTLRPQARLLDDPRLTEWIDRLRVACRDKDKTPARYQVALRQIDQAMYEFANRSEQGNDAKYLVGVLRALGRAEQTLANGLAFCKDKYIRPLQGLNPQWLEQADDDSPEFRLAASLAGMRSHEEIGPLRVFLEEVEVTKFINWSPGSTSAVWSKRSLAANLGAVFRRRLLEAFGSMQAGVPLWSPRPAPLPDVVTFLNDELDEAKFAELLWGLLAIDWSTVDFRLPGPEDSSVPFAFGVPRLLVESRAISASEGRWEVATGEANDVQASPNVFQVLASGQPNAVEQCVDRAARRLKSSGRLVHGYRNRERSGRPLAVATPLQPDRLLAAMLFPLSNHDLGRVANAVLYPPEIEE
jgi:CRISPR-associated protein Csx17